MVYSQFFIFLLLLSSFTKANFECHQLLSSHDLRSNLAEGSIYLELVQASDRSDLRQILIEEDIRRYYLGLHHDSYTSYVDRSVNRSLMVNKDVSFGQRLNFHGRWIIKYKGEAAGVINLSAVKLDFMPEEIRENFKINTDQELILSVGYALKKRFRGKNIASGALALIINFANLKLKATYIFASTNNSNLASKAVLTKFGFRPVFTGEKQTKFYL